MHDVIMALSAKCMLFSLYLNGFSFLTILILAT